MKNARWSWAAPLVAVAVAIGVLSVQPARAEPLTPLTPAETQYLEQLRKVFAASHDPVAFNSDGELLQDGRHACNLRDSQGLVGQPATQIAPAISQLSFIYLCPT